MIQADTALADRALGILKRWAEHGSGHATLLPDRWVEIIKAGDWAAALEESERGRRQLRQASPMACLVPDDVRLRIIRSVKGNGKPAGLEVL